MGEDVEQLKSRLREIEEDLAFLRSELPDRAEGPKDYADAAVEIELFEELSAQIETLEAERDRIKARLAQA
jgi:hypothetical protein